MIDEQLYYIVRRFEMNKKLILKLLLLTLLSFSLISCEQKYNISKSNKETQTSIEKEEGNRNQDRKSTRLNSSHRLESRMPSSA